MNLTSQHKDLLAFVKHKHGNQCRKYTDEPYWRHLVRVAEKTSKHLKDCTEIALCHDILEDTACTEKQLYEQLHSIGYTATQASEITDGVVELTDVFIKKDYPDLNRRSRKTKEAERLGKTGYTAQSIKYADLIDNLHSIVDGDPGFARVYIHEAVDILNQMRKGNIHLLIDCCYAVKTAKLALEAKSD